MLGSLSLILSALTLSEGAWPGLESSEAPGLEDVQRAGGFRRFQPATHLASGKFRRRLVGGHQGGISALLFSTHGERLVSGSTDTTALVWDLTGRLNARGKPLSVADLDACWTDLAGENAERAYQSICRLAASPTEMLPFLENGLQPSPRTDARRVARLIADLDSDRFSVREQASKQLEKLGEAATAACRKALASKPSAELRRRLEMLLEKQEQDRWSPSPPRLRILRALEALEIAGTPRARQRKRSWSAWQGIL